MKQLYRRIVLFSILLLSSGSLLAQKEFWNWHFGTNAGVNFSSGNPVAFTNSALSTFEGSATISDKNGNLLFYTDGMKVWNKNNIQMPNGFGLNGNSSSAQSAVVVPRPGSATLYYVFTADAQAGAFGFCYSVVDMSLNGGLGDVTTKNVLLYTPTCEKITAVKHKNGCDIWVLSHQWNTANIYAYRVTAAGVNTTPVISNPGCQVHSGSSSVAIGYMKANPQGTKVAAGVALLTNSLELYDFNNATGVCSNGLNIPTGFTQTYGCEWSPDGKLLYGASGTIYQYNTTLGTGALIIASKVNVGTGTWGALQVGPNGKMYQVTTTSFLNVINNPNVIGTGCNFVANVVPLAGKTGFLGLPSFITSWVIPPVTLSAGPFCLGQGTVFNLSDTSGIMNYNWNFGDPNSGGNNTSSLISPSHTFTSAGTFTVNAIITYACRTDTVKLNVTIVSCGFTVTANSGSVCPGGCKSVTATPAAGVSPYTYSWNTGATTQTINPCPTANTTYTVLVTDAGGATATATATLTVNPAININTSVINVKCNGQANGSASATVSGGTSPYTYSWNNNQSTASASGLAQGGYTLTVTDASGCTKTASVSVTQPNQLTVAAAGGSISCNGGNNGSAGATASGGTTNYTYNWSNGQTSSNAIGLTAGTYTITITDANGCTATATATVTQPAAVTLQTSTVNSTCANPGSASATGSGGTGTFTYIWTPGNQTAQTATGLNTGGYTVTATDGNGCTQTASVTISGTSGPTLNASGTNVLCNGGTSGTASVTASGGTGTMTYLWSNAQNTQGATGLTAGTYSVVVSDGNGCTATAQVTITEPAMLTVTATGSNACSNANATSVVAGGTVNYTYLWSNAQTTQNATGLGTGVYTLTVTDANGCSASDTATVNISAAPVVVFTADDTAGCVALCVNFTCSTANINAWTWNFGDGSSSGFGAATSHCYKTAGSFSVTLTVTDNNGCTGSLTRNNYISVFPNVGASFAASPQPTTVLNPVITFTDLSTGGAISWNWSFGDLLNSTSTLQNPSFNYKDSGCYNVRLIADNQYNCPDTSDQVVCILGDYELFAPNAFTPDGNGLNDNWNVRGIGIDPDHFELYIFDRWGSLIFKTTDLFEGWNGHANGGRDIAQQDVYVWKVFTRDFLGNKHSYIGHLSLVR